MLQEEATQAFPSFWSLCPRWLHQHSCAPSPQYLLVPSCGAAQLVDMLRSRVARSTSFILAPFRG